MTIAARIGPVPVFSSAPSRRALLRQGLRLAVAGSALPLAKPALAARADARSLSLSHTHTGERVSLVYALGDQYLPESLGRLNHFLRDHYSGEVGQIDPQLFDLLHRVKLTLGGEPSFQVISGYRCPATNDRLRNTRGGGVAQRSLHMDGKAIDIRIAGLPLAELRDAALSLRGGGVGFYARDQFVHVDTGRVRSW